MPAPRSPKISTGPHPRPVADTLRYADALDAMNAARTVDEAVAALSG